MNRKNETHRSRAATHRSRPAMGLGAIGSSEYQEHRGASTPSYNREENLQ